MDIDHDRATFVENDYTRKLSEKYDRLCQEKIKLEELKQKACELRKCFYRNKMT